MVLNWLIRERGEWTALMNGLWASEPNCLLSKNEGGIQFIELRPSDIIWSAERGSAADGKGRKRFCAHFYFYLVINLRRRWRGGPWNGRVPRDAPGCRAGWSCPASAWLLGGSPPPASTAEWADQCRCLGRTLLCPHSSARSHTLPLKGESKMNKHKKCTKIVIRVSYTSIWNFALKV